MYPSSIAKVNATYGNTCGFYFSANDNSFRNGLKGIFKSAFLSCPRKKNFIKEEKTSNNGQKCSVANRNLIISPLRPSQYLEQLKAV